MDKSYDHISWGLNMIKIIIYLTKELYFAKFLNLHYHNDSKLSFPLYMGGKSRPWGSGSYTMAATSHPIQRATHTTKSKPQKTSYHHTKP